MSTAFSKFSQRKKRIIMPLWKHLWLYRPFIFERAAQARHGNRTETLTAHRSFFKQEVSKTNCIFSGSAETSLSSATAHQLWTSITSTCPKKSCLNSASQMPDAKWPCEIKFYELYLGGAVGLWKVVFCVFCLQVTISLSQLHSPPPPRGAAFWQLRSKTASSPGV